MDNLGEDGETAAQRFGCCWCFHAVRVPRTFPIQQPFFCARPTSSYGMAVNRFSKFCGHFPEEGCALSRPGEKNGRQWRTAARTEPTLPFVSPAFLKTDAGPQPPRRGGRMQPGVERSGTPVKSGCKPKPRSGGGRFRHPVGVWVDSGPGPGVRLSAAPINFGAIRMSHLPSLRPHVFENCSSRTPGVRMPAPLLPPPSFRLPLPEQPKRNVRASGRDRPPGGPLFPNSDCRGCPCLGFTPPTPALAPRFPVPLRSSHCRESFPTIPADAA